MRLEDESFGGFKDTGFEDTSSKELCYELGASTCYKSLKEIFYKVELRILKRGRQLKISLYMLLVIILDNSFIL